VEPKDPYRYFRIEAREILDGLTQGALALEKGATKELVGQLLRLAHTLKGAARIVRQTAISELCHGIEDRLASHRDGQTPVPREVVTSLLAAVDAIAARLQALAPSPAAAAPQPALAVEEPLETVRVESKELDDLLHLATEATVGLGALGRQVSAIDRALRLVAALERRHGGPVLDELQTTLRQLRDGCDVGLDAAARKLGRLREQTAELRLVQASAVFAGLERCARDAAEAVHRRIEFTAAGGEHRLDAQVLRPVREALVQIVRNAVAHGIEPAATRAAQGKPAAGRVELLVERHGHRTTFTCRDDGQGLDVDAIRRVAQRSGAVAPGEAAQLDLDHAIDLVLHGGVSTTTTVSEVAGRGIGLDVVRDTARRLRGQVRIASAPGRGTTVTLDVPNDVESLQTLDVEAGGQVVSIPFGAVRETLRVDDGDIATAPGGASIVVGGASIPYRPLAELLDPRSARRRPARRVSVVVLQERGRLAAIGVDRLLRTGHVVSRPLPALLRHDQSGGSGIIGGGAIDVDGDPQLIVDPAGITALLHQGPYRVASRAAAPRPPLLVIDDSLTTRMLEQSILESAGYEVEVAVSAEEGLHKARLRAYGVFVVDVEMPGMNGFEFIEKTQADAALRGVPAILVTSRASAEDRRRGAAAGAKAYLVKSEFDEGLLLRTIRRLLGEEEDGT
jgi:two-component system chemotaxis sensor kinase CheA